MNFNYVIVDILLPGRCEGERVRTILSKNCILENNGETQLSTALFTSATPESSIYLDRVIMEEQPIPTSWIKYECWIKIVCGSKSDAIQLMYTPTGLDEVLGKINQQENLEHLNSLNKPGEDRSLPVSSANEIFNIPGSSSITEDNDFNKINLSIGCEAVPMSDGILKLNLKEVVSLFEASTENNLLCLHHDFVRTTHQRFLELERKFDHNYTHLGELLKKLEFVAQLQGTDD